MAPLAKITVEQSRLRRIALQQQGLSKANPFGRGRNATAAALCHLGYVQIDTISVVERAHHHVLRSRVANYSPDHLRRLLADGEIFEYWSHAAAFLPMQDFRFSLPRKRRYREGVNHWAESRDEKLMTEILVRVRSEGALRSRDFEHPREGERGWWDWKPAKRALEQLFMQGDLMVSSRDGFQKSYDLRERVLPATVNTSEPTAAEFVAHLLDNSLRAHGFVSAKSVTYLRKGAELRTALQAELQQRLADGALVAVSLASGEQFYGAPELLDLPLPRVRKAVHILSPFDNALIQRQRNQTLFDFDYQIECYVPAAKRQYGYFCLPLLYGDSLIGRMDCKAHRKQCRLEVRQLHLERDVTPGPEVLAALAVALQEFASFNGCDTVQLVNSPVRGLCRALQRAMESR
jgi:uncharacterized protein YcaQ